MDRAPRSVLKMEKCPLNRIKSREVVKHRIVTVPTVCCFISLASESERNGGNGGNETIGGGLIRLEEIGEDPTDFAT